MGRAREADSVLADARARAEHRHVTNGTFAMIHLGRGRLDSAFVWLARAADDNDANVVYAKVDPRFDAVRSDPRFHALLKRMNLE